LHGKLLKFPYFEAQVVGTFLVQKLSLTAMKTPSRGSDFPFAILVADSSAFFTAKSSVKVVKALNFLLNE
jgi:hypothetical protein